MPRKKTVTLASADGVELARLPLTTPPNGAPGFNADSPQSAPGGPFIVMPQTPTEERRDRELEDVIAEIGSDMTVLVYNEGKYAGRISGDGFTLDVLMDKFGGGEKTLVIQQGGKNRERVKVSLDPSVPAFSPRTPKPVAGAAAPGNLGDISSLIAAMAQAQMSSMQMMQTMMGLSQQQTTTMLSAMTAFMTAKPDRDPMEVAMKMAELLKGKPDSSAAELFTVFEKGMNVAAKLGGGEDGDGVMGVVGEGLKAVTALAEGYRNEKLAMANGAGPGATQPRTPPALPARAAAGDGGVGPGGGVPPGPGGPLPSGGGAPSDQGNPIPGSHAGPDNLTAARPWVRAAAPHRGVLAMMAGRLNPELAAANIVELLDDAALDDLLADIEQDTREQFIGRALGYFGWQATDDMTAWLNAVAVAVLASVEPEPETPAAAS